MQLLTEHFCCELCLVNIGLLVTRGRPRTIPVPTPSRPCSSLRTIISSHSKGQLSTSDYINLNSKLELVWPIPIGFLTEPLRDSKRV